MQKKEFIEFAKTNNLKLRNAGENWNLAEVCEQYICMVISDEEDFNKVKSLLDNDYCYLASATILNGDQWYQHVGFGQLYGDASDVAKQIADNYCSVLDDSCYATYYSADDMAEMDKFMAIHPRAKGECDDEYMQRLIDADENRFVIPLHVSEPGIWIDGNCLLTDKEKAEGIWSYDYDNWRESVICVLIDKQY